MAFVTAAVLVDERSSRAASPPGPGSGRTRPQRSNAAPATKTRRMSHNCLEVFSSAASASALTRDSISTFLSRGIPPLRDSRTTLGGQPCRQPRSFTQWRGACKARDGANDISGVRVFLMFMDEMIEF